MCRTKGHPEITREFSAGNLHRVQTSYCATCRSPYVRVSRSPWSQTKGTRSPLLLPGNSSAATSKSPWAGDSAAAMRALLMEKVISLFD